MCIRLVSPRTIFLALAVFASSVALLLPMLAPNIASAAVLTVTTTDDELNDDADCSLREALVAANSDAAVSGCPAGSGADTIELPAGTYYLTVAGIAEDAAATGDLDVNSDVAFVGTGVDPSTIDATNITDRVFHLGPLVAAFSTYAVTFDNLVIRGGDTDSLGGGIYIAGGEATTTLIGSRVEYNDAALAGGGIYKSSGSTGDLSVVDSTIQGNTSVNFGAGLAIAGLGSTLVEDSLFLRNIDDGLGSSTAGGGGIMVTSSAPVTIRRTTFLENETGADGGGLHTRNGGTVIENSTFALNVAGGGGGAISCGTPPVSSCGLQVRSTTIHQNSAATGGGIADQVAPANIGLRNSIVAGNTSMGPGPDVLGFYTSYGHNLIGVADGATVTTPDPTDLSGTSSSPLDPDLGPLAQNGFAPLVFQPNMTSPAVDSGLTPFPVDQRGEPRPAGAADDRGAVETRYLNMSLYIDLGADAGSPGPALGAAAGTAGEWQTLGLGLATDLTSAFGYATGVSVDVQSESDTSIGIPASSTDLQRLLNDSIHGCQSPASWSLAFADLPNGQYTIYIYGSGAIDEPSGGIAVQGDLVPGIPGGSQILIEGTSYQTRFTTVSDGTLSITGTFFFNCVGVAGVQVLPEPGLTTGLLFGLMGLVGATRAGRCHPGARHRSVGCDPRRPGRLPAASKALGS